MNDTDAREPGERAAPTSGTAAAVALAHVDVPGARVVREAVNGDLAAVIVATTACDPPLAFLCRVRRGQDGWRFNGLGSLGANWGIGPPGEGGSFAYGIETTADVAEVHVRIEQSRYVVPVSEGFGALITRDIPPDHSWEVPSYKTISGDDVEGNPPPPRTFIRQPDPARLAAIGDARHFVWATQMQIERFVSAFHRDDGSILVPPTPEQQRAASLTFAEAEFLLNAAGQADKALRRIANGPRLSAAITEDIRDLRNLHEHWDEQRASFAHPQLARERAGRSFTARHPDDRPWEFKFAAGDSGGHWISVLRVEDLWNELEAVDRELSRMRNAELDGTATSHVAEDENRPLRPMPQPAGGRVLAKSVLTQPMMIGDPYRSGPTQASGASRP